MQSRVAVDVRQTLVTLPIKYHYNFIGRVTCEERPRRPQERPRRPQERPQRPQERPQRPQERPIL